MEQIIKFSISNYLQLCVEAGFSQIQSHITNLTTKKLHCVVRNNYGCIIVWGAICVKIVDFINL